MDEIGKFIISLALFIFGGLAIIFFGFIIPNSGMGGSNFGTFQTMFIFMGVVLLGIGGLILYLRKVSISATSRTSKVKKVRLKSMEKPKKSTISVSSKSSLDTTSKTVESSAEIEEKEDIICITCEFYDKYNPKQKCKYLSEKDREEMLNSGIKCVEYQLHHSLINEI
ncbi:MAG: hypothetical protein ACTSPY_05575 [Candidatus Helarchaeota archaeon]